MKRIRYLSMLLMLLCSTAAWTQEEKFNPDNPLEPGEIPQYFRLTLIAEPAEAAASLNGSGKYTANTTVTLGATPNSGWTLKEWTNKDGISVSSPYKTKGFAETLTAHFEFTPAAPAEPGEIAQNVRWPLTLALEEGGTASGGGRYMPGTKNTIRASVKDQYLFMGWYTSDGETCLTKDQSYEVTMVEGGITLLAKFRYNPPAPDEPGQIKAPHNITLLCDEGGTVRANPERVQEGETTTITAHANSGYKFEGWYQNGVLYTTDLQFDYTQGGENVTFEARFIFVPDAPAEPDQLKDKRYAFYLMNVIGLPGDVLEVPLHLNSQIVAKDMTFQLTFPNDLVPTNVTSPIIAKEATGYNLECTEGQDTEEGETAYIFKLTDSELPQGNIALMTFSVTIPESQELGKDYPIYINQISVTNENGDTEAASARHGRISLYKMGDSNGDNKVNVADIVTTINHIQKQPNEKFVILAADVNKDNEINEDDLTGTADIILTDEDGGHVKSSK